MSILTAWLTLPENRYMPDERDRWFATMVFLVILVVILVPMTTVWAQTDEIQVYDATINKPGQLSFEIHNNYTPIGRTQADFPGGIVPSHALNGAEEWAYGCRNQARTASKL